jgi:hypothetical protein
MGEMQVAVLGWDGDSWWVVQLGRGVKHGKGRLKHRVQDRKGM